jgi:hypothetical protein
MKNEAGFPGWDGRAFGRMASHGLRSASGGGELA